VNHRKIIDACAANGVAIELNANPWRLDLDYTWIEYCMKKEVMMCISPDAHSIQGISDVEYGTIIARKGLMEKKFCLNTFSSVNFLNWLQKKHGHH
jgi:DNA polymerase (family 10)